MREGIKGFMQNDFTKYFLDDGLYVIEYHVLSCYDSIQSYYLKWKLQLVVETTVHNSS